MFDQSHPLRNDEQAMRTHITLPDELIKAVDRLVGKRKRSAFFAEAARERLRREELLRTLKESAGVPPW